MACGRKAIWICLLFLLGAPAWAGISPGKNQIWLRGQMQEVYYFPASGSSACGQVMFFPGDGGFRGFAVTIAKTMAEWGYDVYGVDTKRYLSSYTAAGGLREAQVSADISELARELGGSPGRHFILLGWSEGAGLALLGAAADSGKSNFDGLITMGLPETIFLAWRWEDALTYVTKQKPKEPSVSSAEYLGKVTPLPLMMIQSTHDEYVSLEAAQRLFQAAREPRRFCPVAGSDHRFSGNQQQFFRVLQEGLQWVRRPSR
jgi:alpha-beta hydrolase superfamily lysophospholipase